jgi:hypothetical protein
VTRGRVIAVTLALLALSAMGVACTDDGAAGPEGSDPVVSTTVSTTETSTTAASPTSGPTTAASPTSGPTTAASGPPTTAPGPTTTDRADRPNVLRAAEDIPRCTSGEIAIDQGLMEVDELPPEFLPADAIVNPDAIRARVTRADVPAGTVITDSLFVAPDDPSLVGVC